MMLIAFVSAYLTMKSRFFQISHFKYILSETFFKIFNRTESSSKLSISPFQATTASLAGTVGMGNMAGVATALSIGAPIESAVATPAIFPIPTVPASEAVVA